MATLQLATWATNLTRADLTPGVLARENVAAYFDQLGDVWEIEKNTINPFPCGIVMHPVMDGAMQLSNDIKSQSGSLDDINSVELRVNPEVLILTGKSDPQTGLEGKFSIYHAAAIGLLYGEATPSQFTDDIIRDATVVEMRKKIQVTEDSTVSKAEAYISLNFADKTTKEKHVQHAKGSIENPLTDAELQNKFMEQVRLAIGLKRAEMAYSAFSNIQEMTGVAKIRQLF